MTWHYGIIKTQSGYNIHEIYDDEKGLFFSANPMPPYGENLGEFLEDLFRMVKDAYFWPVYEEKNGKLVPIKRKRRK